MMIKLYRGLVDILTSQCESLNKEFITHIRTFNSGDEGQSFGTAGFWNLLLEVVYILYVKSFVAIGICITIVLAIVFFPLYAVLRSISTAFNGLPRFEQPISYEEPKLENTQEKK